MSGFSSTRAMMLNASHVHVQASGHVRPWSSALAGIFTPSNMSWKPRNVAISPSAARASFRSTRPLRFEPSTDVYSGRMLLSVNSFWNSLLLNYGPLSVRKLCGVQ